MTIEQLAAWLDANGAGVADIRAKTRATALVKDGDIERCRASVIGAYLMPFLGGEELETIAPTLSADLMAAVAVNLTYAAMLLDRLTVTRYTTSQPTHEATNNADRSALSDAVAIYRKRGMAAWIGQLAKLGKSIGDARYRHILLDEL